MISHADIGDDHICSICGKRSTDENMPWTGLDNKMFAIRRVEFCCHHSPQEMIKFVWDNVVDGALPESDKAELEAAFFEDIVMQLPQPRIQIIAIKVPKEFNDFVKDLLEK